MNTELYTKLKHCWKMGYKLPKIKEYCETDYSLDDLQELFMEMWKNELKAYSYKQECDRVLLSRVSNTDSQIADLYNFMDASFRCVGITHWQDKQGDSL